MLKVSCGLWLFGRLDELCSLSGHYKVHVNVKRDVISLQHLTDKLIIAGLFEALQGGNRGLVNAQIIVYSGSEGGDVTVECSLSRTGSGTFFCRDSCDEKDILIETTGVTAHRDRYSIEYRRASGGGRLVVTVKQLRKSDSGLYSCGSNGRLSKQQVEIIVIDAALHDENPSGEKTLYAQTGGSVVVECSFTGSAAVTYFCKDRCEPKDVLVNTIGVKVQRGRYSIEYVEASSSGGFVYVSITQLNTSDSGRYRCAALRGLSRHFREFTLVVTDASTASAPTAATTQTLSSDQQQPDMTPAADVWLYVGLTLAVLVVLLAVAVLIYCRKISAKPEEPPEEPEYASVSQTNRVCEDIGGDRQIRSPEAEDDPSELTYSELNFSSRTHNSALCGKGDDVVYAVPRLKASSASRRAKEDPPLCSAVT
ncbi:uncharacterized protein [Chaetodon trifascialis]|uniref:uncharacterized protein n=1 Tax=Chaetodon trifascialis TaxID=109706 RepID=UPI003991F57D